MLSHTISFPLLAAIAAASPSVARDRPLVPRIEGAPLVAPGWYNPVPRPHEPEYDYNGRYEGDPNEPDSCGEELEDGGTDAPLYYDCNDAVDEFIGYLHYPSRYGRREEQYGDCVVVWHPEDINDGTSVLGSDIIDAILDLRDKCRTGEVGEYVSDYAWHQVPGVGVVSIYLDADDPDYMGDNVD